VATTVRRGGGISEGNKERFQPYEGVVIAKRHAAMKRNDHRAGASSRASVERVFMPWHSPQVGPRSRWSGAGKVSPGPSSSTCRDRGW